MITLLGAGGVALIGGMLLLLPFLLLSLRHLIALTMIIATIMCGTLVYYARIENAMWLPYILAVALFLRFAAQRLVLVNSKQVARTPLPSFAWILVLFVLYSLMISIVHATDLGQFAVGLKNYLPIWLFAPVVAALRYAERETATLEKGAVLLSIIQVPFVWQQAATVRHWDGIVGTYGGDPNGGGASGLLMVFAIVGLLSAISMWQTRRLGMPAVLVVVGLNIIVIGLAEVKAFFVLFPLALVLQQLPTLRRRPIQFLGLLGGATLAIFLLLNVYEQSYSAFSPGRASGDLVQSVARAMSFFFDPYGVNFTTGEVSRGASLALWWGDSWSGFLDRLMGYGAGASRPKSTVAIGVVAQRFAPLNISATALSQLLWDTGVVGATLFFVGIATAMLHALKLARKVTSDALASQLRTMAAILFASVCLLIYDRSLVDAPAMQLLLSVLVGVLVSLSRATGIGVASSGRLDALGVATESRRSATVR